MEVRRRALGRGLGALIPATHYEEMPDKPAHGDPVLLDAITPNPYQPRDSFPEKTIEELADSIRKQGLLQPLVVRRKGSGYELIAGERRFRAARRAGLSHVPIHVLDVGDREALELALVENLQREDLNPMEEARAYSRLIQEFGLTQEQVAERVAKSRPAVANSLRLLQLPAEIRTGVEDGTLSAGHARSLLTLEDQHDRLSAAREVKKRKLSVRETERLVRRRTAASDSIDRRNVEEDLTRALGTRVRLRQRRGGAGHIEIEYYSLDELNGLVSRLSRADATPTVF